MRHIIQCSGHKLKIPNIVKSNGLLLYDEYGKEYLDFESGVWCTSIGHNNAEINQIIKNQLDTLMHAGFCYSNSIIDKAANSILDLAGFQNGKCIFLCSGSEVIEISRQMSQKLTKKNISLTLHDSYLGAYSSITDKSYNWHLLNWEKCKSCPDHDNCDLSCETLRDLPKDISEFIFEPGSSSGHVRFPPKALIRNITQIVKENGGKIIVNEVTTGIGRTGKWFGYQHYDIKPDLIAVGKGIGNGYPVSVALINETTANQIEAKQFRYSQSHQNDPLGASIALGVIRFIDSNNLLLQVEKNGLLFKKHLEELIDNEVILDTRGRGLMLSLDIKDSKITNDIYNSLIESGYIVGNRGSFFRIDPPLTITEEEILSFIDTLDTIISTYKKNA